MSDTLIGFQRLAQLLDATLDEGYKAMAADQTREAEAEEWCNALARDLSPPAK